MDLNELGKRFVALGRALQDDDSSLKPGEEWWMDVAGVPVKLDEWEPGAGCRVCSDD